MHVEIGNIVQRVFVKECFKRGFVCSQCQFLLMIQAGQHTFCHRKILFSNLGQILKYQIICDASKIVLHHSNYIIIVVL